MKTIRFIFILLSIITFNSKGFSQFKSHIESKFRGIGLVYKTMNVNEEIHFKYIDSMPFEKDKIASMDNNESTKADGSFKTTEKDPAWLGVSAHFGNKLENQRKYITYGINLMHYSTDRYAIVMNNFYKKIQPNSNNSETEIYNGTINYHESATIFSINFGYYFETPPVLKNEKLYFFAGISPEIGYSFGRSAHRVLNYSAINIDQGTRKDINIDETVSGKNFLYAQIGPELGAEFLLTELSSVKLQLSPGFGVSSFNNIRSTNNFFQFAVNQRFSVGINYVYYFRD